MFYLNKNRKKLKSVVAATLIAVVLALGIFAASPQAHEWLHADAGIDTHECAITLFSHGFSGGICSGILVYVSLRKIVAVVGLPVSVDVGYSRYRLPPLCGPPQA